MQKQWMAAMLAMAVTQVVGAGRARAEVDEQSWYERWYNTGRDTLGKTVFATAWPTATYEGIRYQSLTPAPGGADLTVRIWGRSNGERRIWTDVIIGFHNYAITDLRLGRHGRVLSPPGETLQTALQTLQQQSASPPPRATSTWATACLLNTSERAIAYEIAWGGMREARQLLPGSSRLYRAQGGELAFHVTLDTSLDDDVAQRSFALPTSLLPDEPTVCEEEDTYQFTVDDQRIGLGPMAWTPGAEHPFLPHVVQAPTLQRWTCEPGYHRLDPDDDGDLRCEP